MLGDNTQAPYVVSCDIVTLLEEWARDKGFILPEQSYFDGLRSEMQRQLSNIFENVIVLPEDDLKSGVAAMIDGETLPIVNMDQVYTDVGFPLEVSRSIDENGNNVAVSNRAGSLSIEEQVAHIAANVQGDIVLVDDVIFSGSLVANTIIPVLKEQGLFVRKIYTAVAIGEGLDLLVSKGVEVHFLHAYKEVSDEICERDFYPGVPFSGRTVAGSEIYGAPYVKPFGRVEEWASIPADKVDNFSSFCLEQTAGLFAEIGRLSGREVLYSDVPRLVLGLEVKSQNTVFSDALMQYVKELN